MSESDLTPVAVDIETTGMAADDEVTVIGFDLPVGVRAFYQTGGRDSADTEAVVQNRTSQTLILSAHRTELALFEAVRGFGATRLRDDGLLLVGYNAETWAGGFDLPFLRTRHATQGCPWPFQEVPYADLFPIVNKLFNTTRADVADDTVDLETAYELLCDGDSNAMDPFEGSDAAITAFENGHFADVVLHNVADITRTAAIAAVAQRYCSKSDFHLKSLTPAVDG